MSQSSSQQFVSKSTVFNKLSSILGLDKLDQLSQNQMQCQIKDQVSSNQSYRKISKQNIKQQLQSFFQYTSQQIIRLSAHYQTKIQYQSMAYEEEISQLKQQISRQYKIIGLMKLQLQDLVILVNERNQINLKQQYNNSQNMNNMNNSQNMNNGNSRKQFDVHDKENENGKKQNNSIMIGEQQDFQIMDIKYHEINKQCRIKQSTIQQHYQIDNNNSRNNSKNIKNISVSSNINSQINRNNREDNSNNQQYQKYQKNPRSYKHEFNYTSQHQSLQNQRFDYPNDYHYPNDCQNDCQNDYYNNNNKSSENGTISGLEIIAQQQTQRTLISVCEEICQYQYQQQNHCQEKQQQQQQCATTSNKLNNQSNSNLPNNNFMRIQQQQQLEQIKQIKQLKQINNYTQKQKQKQAQTLKQKQMQKQKQKQKYKQKQKQKQQQQKQFLMYQKQVTQNKINNEAKFRANVTVNNANTQIKINEGIHANGNQQNANNNMHSLSIKRSLIKFNSNNYDDHQDNFYPDYRNIINQRRQREQREQREQQEQKSLQQISRQQQQTQKQQQQQFKKQQRQQSHQQTYQQQQQQSYQQPQFSIKQHYDFLNNRNIYNQKTLKHQIEFNSNNSNSNNNKQPHTNKQINQLCISSTNSSQQQQQQNISQAKEINRLKQHSQYHQQSHEQQNQQQEYLYDDRFSTEQQLKEEGRDEEKDESKHLFQYQNSRYSHQESLNQRQSKQYIIKPQTTKQNYPNDPNYPDCSKNNIIQARNSSRQPYNFVANPFAKKSNLSNNQNAILTASKNTSNLSNRSNRSSSPQIYQKHSINTQKHSIKEQTNEKYQKDINSNVTQIKWERQKQKQQQNSSDKQLKSKLFLQQFKKSFVQNFYAHQNHQNTEKNNLQNNLKRLNNQRQKQNQRKQNNKDNAFYYDQQRTSKGNNNVMSILQMIALKNEQQENKNKKPTYNKPKTISSRSISKGKAKASQQSNQLLNREKNDRNKKQQNFTKNNHNLQTKCKQKQNNQQNHKYYPHQTKEKQEKEQKQQEQYQQHQNNQQQQFYSENSWKNKNKNVRFQTDNNYNTAQFSNQYQCYDQNDNQYSQNSNDARYSECYFGTSNINSGQRDIKSLQTTFGRPASSEYLRQHLSAHNNRINAENSTTVNRKGSTKTTMGDEKKKQFDGKQNQKNRKMSYNGSACSGPAPIYISKKIYQKSGKAIKPPIEQSIHSMLQSHLQSNNKFLVGCKKQQVKYDGERISVSSYSNPNGSNSTGSQPFSSMRHGHGTLYYSNGLIYDGQFVNNKREGFGILKFNHVELYAGEWRDDQLFGQGKIRNCAIINKKKKQAAEKQNVAGSSNIFAKWISYCGQFVHNRFEGEGTLYLQGGQKFVGHFKNGATQGQGSLFKKNGQVENGTWKNNILIERLETEWN